jgi:hypothetical protein
MKMRKFSEPSGSFSWVDFQAFPPLPIFFLCNAVIEPRVSNLLGKYCTPTLLSVLLKLCRTGRVAQAVQHLSGKHEALIIKINKALQTIPFFTSFLPSRREDILGLDHCFSPLVPASLRTRSLTW